MVVNARAQFLLLWNFKLVPGWERCISVLGDYVEK
jgi:hypothetical protein